MQILAIADADLQTTKALEVADHALSTATKLLLVLVKLWCPHIDEKQAAVLQSCLTPDVNSADDVVSALRKIIENAAVNSIFTGVEVLSLLFKFEDRPDISYS